MARTVRKSPTLVKPTDDGGDAAPLKPLIEIAASTVPFHPIANIFPLLKGAEFEELVEDVRANGLVQPIILYEGKILDGRNRYRACLKSGIAPKWDEFPGGNPMAYAISANIHRRHLTSKQKRDLIAKVLKIDPSRSDNAIGKEIGASHHTVGEVRTELQDVGNLPTSPTRTDTKGREQPAKKSKPKSIRPSPPAKPELVVKKPVDIFRTEPPPEPLIKPAADRRAANVAVNGTPRWTQGLIDFVAFIVARTPERRSKHAGISIAIAHEDVDEFDLLLGKAKAAIEKGRP